MKIAKDPEEAGSITEFVPLFKALCNPTRAQIIEFLLGGERCVCEMTGPLDLSQPLVSHHLGLCAPGRNRQRARRGRADVLLDQLGALRRRPGRALVAYVERLRSSPHPTLNVASACATPAARARKKLA